MASDFQMEARQLERARKHFERRRKAALAGLHLPTGGELLGGMPFLADDIQEDMQAFAERLAPRLRRKSGDAGVAAVVNRLEQLTVGAGLDEVWALADAFSVAASALPPDLRSWWLRCRIYAAHLGDQRAAMDLARDAVVMACKLEVLGPKAAGSAVDMTRAALGWLCFSASDMNFRYLGDGDLIRFWREPATTASQSGRMLINLVERKMHFAEVGGETPSLPEKNESEAAPPSSKGEPDKLPLPASVVFENVGNGNTGEGKKVVRELEELLGKALPLVPMPDLAIVRKTLRSEFPYATEVIDQILRDIPARSYVKLRPTIVLGPSGCGKSRFVRRLLTLLNVPHDVIPCGGISDGAFAGTARRWSSGEPSLPVALITRYKIAGPGAVLDEIEKAGTSRHNGKVHDALLAFLEQETACRFHDPYVQAPCDLSHVAWLMTANSLDGLITPFKDRCRIIQFPAPGREHLPTLSRQILADLLAEQGLDHRWASPLDEIEMEAVARAWPGGSLRMLRRMVEITLATRRAKH